MGGIKTTISRLVDTRPLTKTIVIFFILAFAIELLVAYLPPNAVINTYTKLVLVRICINIILCLSLNLVNGYMGEFSVGHAGFMGLGAYSSAIMTTMWFPDLKLLFFPSVIFGGLIAAGIGFFLALLSFKTRGDYLAIITLAFLMIVKSFFENFKYSGGSSGIMGIDNYSSLPWCLFWVVVCVWVIRNLVYSKYGRAIVAIREDEIAANAMGVRVREAKILAFVVSSFFGGVAGAIFAHQNNFINPASFDIAKSTEILVMVYLGGIGSIFGSILGASIFSVLFEALNNFERWRNVIMPLLLVLLMIFRPRGIFGLKELSWFLPKRELSHRHK